MNNYEDIVDAIDAYVDAVRRTEAARIDAGACGTRRDFDRYRKAQDEESLARERCLNTIGLVVRVD